MLVQQSLLSYNVIIFISSTEASIVTEGNILTARIYNAWFYIQVILHNYVHKVFYSCLPWNRCILGCCNAWHLLNMQYYKWTSQNSVNLVGSCSNGNRVNKYIFYLLTTGNMKSTAYYMECSYHQYLHLSMTVTVKDHGYARLSQWDIK